MKNMIVKDAVIVRHACERLFFLIDGPLGRKRSLPVKTARVPPVAACPALVGDGPPCGSRHRARGVGRCPFSLRQRSPTYHLFELRTQRRAVSSERFPLHHAFMFQPLEDIVLLELALLDDEIMSRGQLLVPAFLFDD